MLNFNPLYHFNKSELYDYGIKDVGNNVAIDRSVRFYGCDNIHIGSNVRIDAFCVISGGKGGIFIGNYIHISVGVTILGQEKVVLDDFSGLSARVSIFTSNDDYTGGSLTNPTIPDKYRKITSGPVILNRHVIVGTGSIILPGVNLGLGSSVGALSLVNKSVPDFNIVAGIPAKMIGKRSQTILNIEKDFLNNLDRSTK